MAGAVIVAGYAAGSIAEADDDSGKSQPLTFTEKLPPYDRLPSGLTAGTYRIDTPLDERPDVVPARTVDGRAGYFRVEDFDPRVTDFDVTSRSRALSPAESARLRDARSARLADDSDGDVWAPVYAADGTTVIGRATVGAAR